ncbi:hypothetical protein NGUA11_03449 [Salmonella enterica]|nr:hypothetical protein NGUA11_03449 [Salmonella enterica]
MIGQKVFFSHAVATQKLLCQVKCRKSEVIGQLKVETFPRARAAAGNH